MGSSVSHEVEGFTKRIRHSAPVQTVEHYGGKIAAAISIPVVLGIIAAVVCAWLFFRLGRYNKFFGGSSYQYSRYYDDYSY